jgi:hypothetical protein
MSKNLLLICCVIFLYSCWGFGNKSEIKEKIEGYKPVYSTDPTLLYVTTEGPKPVKNAGKIFAIGNYIFQNEFGLGIHVIDRTNPTQLMNKGFINIRGNTELTVKGTILYANSFSDLVIIDFSDWQHPKELNRIKNAISLDRATKQSFVPLPEKNVYALCPDPTKGTHIGWEKQTISLLECYFYN